MAEYILRDQAIIAVTGAKLPDVSASGLPIANGKRSVTDCVRRLKDIPAADVRPVVLGRWETVMLDHERMGCRPTAYYCSECHQITWFRTFFCPNCGADMRETNDEKA